MNKVWLYIIDIFVAILIIFISVTIYFGIRTETVMKSIYEKTTEEFIADVKKRGVIYVNDYEKFIKQMGTGNSLFNISLEHRHNILEPEYRFRTLEEIIDEQNRKYTGANEYHYREVITERPHVDDPINDGNLNTETNESVLENAVDTPTDPNHVHTDECYNGTKHIHTGNSSSGGGCYGKYVPGEQYICGSISYVGTGRRIDTVCGFNGCTAIFESHYGDGKCNTCGASTTYSRIIKGNCNHVSNSMTYYSTHYRSSPSYYEINCGKTEGKYYDSNGNEVHPICGLIVESLTPTHPIQTVYINDPLITTATATYKDGSTKVLLCATDFSTSTLVKDRTVILKYNYIVDGTSHSKTCTISVTVIPRNAACHKGHLYNLNNDGTDPGCPYCKAWIESLRVIHPDTSPIVITIGTTLQENGVIILATYMDGHTEEVSSGYIDNLDTGYLGTQAVTIGYKGASITVLVNTIRATMICDICGYKYELYPDGTNPGCPRCIQQTPVFTGNIMEYEHLVYTDQILDELYDKGKYTFNVDDVFGIRVSNKSSNIARKLLRKIYPSLSDKWFVLEKNEYIMSK